ncbi:hypothetical protein DFH28DRAFT_527791 [Melampsora americana]|nr:hypothetical protein DFH28DRAFT_527791 [Melampsora americana]
MSSQLILSEIDAIFATTKTSKNQITNNTTKNSEEKTNKRKKDDSKPNQIEINKLGTEEKKKKKKKKENPIKETEEKDKDLGEVEEIIDPSINILKISNQTGGIDSKISGSSSGSKKILLDDDELAFRDSRGTRAKTDDGLPIYSVEELNIGLGGDTEACPFDCDCCF